MLRGKYGKNRLILDIYKNRKVLITGHTGFKGAWLSIWLKELNANVTGFSLPNWHNDFLFKKAGLSKKIIDERGDIRDFKRLTRVFLKYKPEIVFHLAAQPLVRDSYLNPLNTFQTNTQGTVNILESIRTFKFVKCAVIVTTDKCYKNKDLKKVYTETDELGGYDPYSASKAAAELAIDAYRKSFFSGSNKLIASARAGNNIGGGDFSRDRLIPDCIRSLTNNRPIKVRNPKSTRPWQHVLEALYGYLLLGSKLLNKEREMADSWNFGPEKGSFVSVSDVVNNVMQNWGNGKWVNVHNPQDRHESKYLNLNISKAKEILGWRPKWNIETTIEKTISWYKNANNKNSYNLCAYQINEYLNEK